MFHPLHYEFKDWEKAFEEFEKMYSEHGEAVCLVISEGPYTSGYWIESATMNLTPTDTRYNYTEAMELRKRVIKEIQFADYHMRPPRFIK